MVNFGFKTVKEDEKKHLVSSVFASVAQKYNLMNNLMSFGVQKIWKKNLCDFIAIKDGGNYLDLAAGNGDISDLLIKKAEQEGKNITITLCDASEEMLETAKNRINSDNVKFVVSFAEDLNFEEEEFDSVFISFGIRNFTNIDQALEKIYKILKKNGDLFCLEFFSDVSNKLFFDKIYKIHLLKTIPFIGKIIAKDEDSYKYFGESILQFYSKKDFKNLLQKSNFRYFNSINGLLSIVSFFQFKK